MDPVSWHQPVPGKERAQSTLVTSPAQKVNFLGIPSPCRQPGKSAIMEAPCLFLLSKQTVQWHFGQRRIQYISETRFRRLNEQLRLMQGARQAVKLFPHQQSITTVSLLGPISLPGAVLGCGGPQQTALAWPAVPPSNPGSHVSSLSIKTPAGGRHLGCGSQRKPPGSGEASRSVFYLRKYLVHFECSPKSPGFFSFQTEVGLEILY